MKNKNIMESMTQFMNNQYIFSSKVLLTHHSATKY